MEAPIDLMRKVLLFPFIHTIVEGHYTDSKSDRKLDRSERLNTCVIYAFNRLDLKMVVSVKLYDDCLYLREY